jgi:hypothetical protein
MTRESPAAISSLKSIHIDLEARSVETLAQDGVVVRFTFSPEGVFQQLLAGGSLEGAARRLLEVSQPDATERETAAETDAGVLSPARSIQEASAQEVSAASREKQPALVLPGRLQTKPMDGRPDGRGKPTAWARLLAHLEDREGAVLLSVTFHNRTRDIALGLVDGDAITAQGYLHPSRDPERLSTFSVFHLINYPGKPSRKSEAVD